RVFAVSLSSGPDPSKNFPLHHLVHTVSTPSQPWQTVSTPVALLFSFHVRSTGRADTMARIARHRALFALPADAPLTPRTFNQVKTIPQHHELRSEFAILRLEMARYDGHLVYPLQHRGTRSSSKIGDGGYTL